VVAVIAKEAVVFLVSGGFFVAAGARGKASVSVLASPARAVLPAAPDRLSS